MPIARGGDRGLKVIYAQKTFERVFKQTIADIQQEHMEAIAKGVVQRSEMDRSPRLLVDRVPGRCTGSDVNPKVVYTLWKAAS